MNSKIFLIIRKIDQKYINSIDSRIKPSSSLNELKSRFAKKPQIFSWSFGGQKSTISLKMVKNRKFYVYFPREKLKMMRIKFHTRF